jgi:hypothetical protein
MSNDVSMKWQYGPPFFYIGLYEEESKAFEIVGAVRHEQLISKPKRNIYISDNIFHCLPGAYIVHQTATGATIAIEQRRGLEVARKIAMRKTGRGDGTGLLG